MLYSLAYRIVGEEECAEDVVQETFLSVWRMARSFDVDRWNARTWLMSVVHHRAIDTIRLRRGQPQLDLSVVPAHYLAGPDNVWQEVATASDREAIMRALSQVPEEQRQVIEMAYFGGYTHSEIAGLLGSPLGTVKGRIRLALEKLRALLQERKAGVWGG